jgi:hypothetical protein
VIAWRSMCSPRGGALLQVRSRARVTAPAALGGPLLVSLGGSTHQCRFAAPAPFCVASRGVLVAMTLSDDARLERRAPVTRAFRPGRRAGLSGPYSLIHAINSGNTSIHAGSESTTRFYPQPPKHTERRSDVHRRVGRNTHP